MRTPSALRACAALGLLLLLCHSAPCAAASRPQASPETPAATAQAQQATQQQQQQQQVEASQTQGLAAAFAAWIQSAAQPHLKASDEATDTPETSSSTATPKRFGRGPGLPSAGGAGASEDATSAAAMPSRAEKLRAWWSESAAAWGSSIGSLRRRFHLGRADVSGAQDDVTLGEGWQAYTGELEDAVLGSPEEEHGGAFHQVKAGPSDVPSLTASKRSPATRRRWSIQLVVRRSRVAPQMPLSSLGRQDTHLELRPQQEPEVEVANPGEAWHRYAADFTD